MIPLYSNDDFLKAKSLDKLPCECMVCHSMFFKEKRYITNFLKHGTNSSNFCGQTCRAIASRKSKNVKCKYCNNSFIKRSFEIKKSLNHFCSKSCAVTYNNTHKTHGTRRSKLEIWLEQELPAIYPSLEFHFNRKDAINSELDIYIPSLKLAFELNGLFHYEPIFGPEKLAQIQNNDQRKYQACIERGIELCLIDVSSLKYFKEKNILKYLSIIKEIIDRKRAVPTEVESV